MITVLDVLMTFLLAMLVLRFLVVVFNFVTYPTLPKKFDDNILPKVSVLIPARNEEAVLPLILNDLMKLSYSNLEIIVCNDNSSDGTQHVLETFSKLVPNISYFTNHELPNGWVGKNYACYQLAKRATGEYLLFIDADVRLKPNAIQRAVGYALKQKTALLSVFPQQIMKSFGEKCVVPVMNWILLSFLPLKSVSFPWFSSLSAANGQFMLFQAHAYHKNQWHKQVKDKNVEDILIARLMKKARLKISVLVADDDISCRMYNSKQEAINGFARNFKQYFSGSNLWMTFFVFVTWTRLPLFILFGFFEYFLLSVVFVFLMRLLTTLLSHQKIGVNVILHPVQIFYMTLIYFKTIRNARKVEWKGRIYN
jgi:glycosyltransferase involved in cell wall biosynthesis